MMIHRPKRNEWLPAPDGAEAPGSLRAIRRCLASRLLGLADQHLPGDEAELLRAWLAVLELPVGTGTPRATSVPITASMDSLVVAFADKQIRGESARDCLIHYILPELRRWLADDVECQRLMSSLGETGPFV